MRTTIVAMIFASGTMIALPAQAQQTTPNSQTQQMQDKADKGVKTHQSGNQALWASRKSRALPPAPLGGLTLLRRQRVQPPAPRPGRQAAVKGRAEPPGGCGTWRFRPPFPGSRHHRISTFISWPGAWFTLWRVDFIGKPPRLWGAAARQLGKQRSVRTVKGRFNIRDCRVAGVPR